MTPPIPYCLNIHPGEGLADVRQAIETHACAVKARVSPDAPYPLGLRLSAAAAEALSDPAALEAFQELLGRHALFVTGLNGFPYGAFHNTAVKTDVYRPDWSRPERLAYTGRLAALLAALLPEGRAGSVSTVPLAYRRHAPDSDTWRTLCARQVCLQAELLHTLLQEQGREVVLALEPEPDCLLEDSRDVLSWFEDELLAEGRRWLAARRRRTPDEAEALLRRHVGLCLDTCHFSVAFEEPLAALQGFERAGLRVARVQLSAALRATVADEALARLAAFIDPVYLHQTKLRLPRGRLLALPDLTPATLDEARRHPGAELRTHFHVPLFFAGDGPLEPTTGDLTPAFFAHVAAQGYPLETETYTFGVLPDALRPASVVECLVAEHAWAAGRLAAAAAAP